MGVRVRMTYHAEIRADQRLGRRVHGEIARGLLTVLRLGVHPGPQLEVEVRLADGGRAVLVPDPMGGWRCVTCIRKDQGGAVA